MKTDIAGVLIDNLSKQEVLDKVTNLVHSTDSGYVVTPYSEMIVFAMRDEKYKQVLNNAVISVPDGIGILWAGKYLSLKEGGRVIGGVREIGVLIWTLLAIPLNPTYIRSVIKERITGSRLIFDIAKLAADNGYSISLVGGQDNVAQVAGEKLKKLHPNLKVNLAISDREFNAQTTQEIADSDSDILLIAYSPPRQEMWLAENIQNLNVSVAIGLGGTFDYLAGKRPPAPEFLHFLGLEWLWRLITQPHRWKRMWNAVPVFVWKVYRYKVKELRNKN
jgi:N-acetylglucosaminyldiphosphoundecaprenol N-acetyl-beta-D-mannosaminyltransferase